MADGFYVVIKSYKDKDYAHKIGPMASERAAEKVDRGANINLNHDEYYTVIEKPEASKSDPAAYEKGITVINGMAYPNGPRGLDR
jgi:hypothetical protein